MASLSERLSGARVDQDSEHTPRTSGAQPSDTAKASPRQNLGQVKARIQRQLIAELGPEADLNTNQGRRRVESLLNELVEAEGLPIPRFERTRLLEAIIAEVLAYGPIEPLLRDPSISEVMVNGPDQVWVYRLLLLSW